MATLLLNDISTINANFMLLLLLLLTVTRGDLTYGEAWADPALNARGSNAYATISVINGQASRSTTLKVAFFQWLHRVIRAVRGWPTPFGGPHELPSTGSESNIHKFGSYQGFIPSSLFKLSRVSLMLPRRYDSSRKLNILLPRDLHQSPVGRLANSNSGGDLHAMFHYLRLGLQFVHITLTL